MSIYVGGKRLRLIKDNFESSIRNSLTTLGWFDNNRRHAPVTLVAEQLDPHNELSPNIIGIAFDDMIFDEIEVGSSFSENQWSVYIDIFAESESVGLHLAGDIFDILRGKFSVLGDTDILRVYDLTQATPDQLFYCLLENSDIARVKGWSKPHTKYWWTVYCEIHDYYADEGDA